MTGRKGLQEGVGGHREGKGEEGTGRLSGDGDGRGGGRG